MGGRWWLTREKESKARLLCYSASYCYLGFLPSGPLKVPSETGLQSPKGVPVSFP